MWLSILSWLLGSKVGRYVAVGGIAVLFALVVLARVYSAGKAKERARQQEVALKNLRERMKVDDEITKLTPTQRRERLSRWVSSDGV